ncbi:28S ribosomal protein S9, mitochondrial-like [Mytilus californianus]|uniref:28S ribosomal protein S9, mitochondrial-like n=1 Tax=Mytilus californianus TaxID=6549 RepID=UPI002245637B|nr:28S ribosomal protein S9, mitochondrial-like [Mytilus californianus]
MAAPMKHSATFLSHICSKEYILLRRSFMQSQLICAREKNSESVTSVRIDSKILKTPTKTDGKAQKISRAMRAYLEKAKRYQDAMDEQNTLYEVGKRHLANMMGEDPESFTHKDVKRAVAYLLPSGLHEKKARPVMPLPVDILPVQKVVQFGTDGRPFHFMFYTTKPVFSELLHDVTRHLRTLKAKEDEFYRADKFDQIYENTLKFVDSDWISYDRFTLLFKEERISQDDYKLFLKNVQRLVDHPLNHKVEDFIMRYREKFQGTQTNPKYKILEESEDGSKVIRAEGGRKTAKAEVKLISPGTGKFTCNGQPINYFPSVISREQIMFPLELAGKLGQVDVEAKVEGGGQSGQSGAIRLGISRCLVSIVDEETVQKMRLAGLLTRDPRMRERSKPFKKGARKGRVWKKR